MANNKVVIFSMEHNEISTNDVIDWIYYFGNTIDVGIW
jgi:hypothetical protein